MMDLPCARQGVNEFIDLLLGADIYPARGFIDDDNVRLGQHDLGNQQLLLVAT